MPRYRTARSIGEDSHPLPPAARFSSQQLLLAALVVFGLFIGISVFLSTYVPSRLTPDNGYAVPAGWNYPGIMPPRGSTPVASPVFLPKTPGNYGFSFELTEGDVDKKGVAFSHKARPAEMQRYFWEILEAAEYTESDGSAVGIDPAHIVAVWNSKYGNISVILLYYDERYELIMHEVP